MNEKGKYDYIAVCIVDNGPYAHRTTELVDFTCTYEANLPQFASVAARDLAVKRLSTVTLVGVYRAHNFVPGSHDFSPE